MRFQLIYDVGSDPIRHAITAADGVVLRLARGRQALADPENQQILSRMMGQTATRPDHEAVPGQRRVSHEATRKFSF